MSVMRDVLMPKSTVSDDFFVDRRTVLSSSTLIMAECAKLLIFAELLSAYKV